MVEVASSTDTSHGLRAILQMDFQDACSNGNNRSALIESLPRRGPTIIHIIIRNQLDQNMAVPGNCRGVNSRMKVGSERGVCIN